MSSWSWYRSQLSSHSSTPPCVCTFSLLRRSRKTLPGRPLSSPSLVNITNDFYMNSQGLNVKMIKYFKKRTCYEKQMSMSILIMIDMWSSAGVETNILMWDILYDQRAISRHLQSFRFSRHLSVGRDGNWCIWWITEQPVSFFTCILFISHVITRQSDIISISDNKSGWKRSSDFCWKEKNYQF